MKDLNSLTWSEINALINDLDSVELANNLSWENIEKVKEAGVIKSFKGYFKDDETFEKVIDLADYLYFKDEEDHTKDWYVYHLSELINAGYDIDDLEEKSKRELFDMVYDTEYYAEIAKNKRLTQEPEREL